MLHTPDQLDSLTRAKRGRLSAEDSDGDTNDITHANSIAGGYQTLGYGVQSSPAVANTLDYAGYEFDPTFQGAGRHLYHVRHRVYDAGVGRRSAAVYAAKTACFGCWFTKENAADKRRPHCFAGFC